MSNAIVPRDFYVYAHKRATTGEIFYIGKGNGRRAYDKQMRNRYWHHIVNKNGYTVEIVQDELQEFSAFELERDLIALHGRKDCKLGPLVNGTDGGDGVSGIILSPETIEKMSEASKKTWAKDGHKEKMRVAMKTAMDTPEYKLKISEAGKEIWQDKDYRAKMLAVIRKTQDAIKKPVVCVENGQVFASAIEVAKFLRATEKTTANDSKIYTCCIGKQKTAYGYTWRFLNDTLENQERRAETLARVAKSESANRKAVLCVSTGVTQLACNVSKPYLYYPLWKGL